MKEFRQTDKQMEIVQKVFEAADRGEYLTIVGLWKSLSYGATCTKQAVLCSLNILKAHDIIETVYGKVKGEFIQGRIGYLKPTPSAYRRFRPNLRV